MRLGVGGGQQKEKDRKNIWSNNDQNFPDLMKTRFNVPQAQKHEENYAKVYHNQVDTMWEHGSAQKNEEHWEW